MNTDRTVCTGLHTQSSLNSLMSASLQNLDHWGSERLSSLNPGREMGAGKVNKERSSQTDAMPLTKVSKLQHLCDQKYMGFLLLNMYSYVILTTVLLNKKHNCCLRLLLNSQLHSLFRSMSTRPHLSAILH